MAEELQDSKKNAHPERGLEIADTLRDLQLQHEARLCSITRQLHIEHESRVAGIVQQAVKQAVAQVSQASLPPPLSPSPKYVPVQASPFETNDDLKQDRIQRDVLVQDHEKAQQGRLPSDKLDNASKSPAAGTSLDSQSPPVHREMLDGKSMSREILDADRAGKHHPLKNLNFEDSVKEVEKTVDNVVNFARADSCKTMEKVGWKKTLQDMLAHPIGESAVALVVLANSITIAVQTEIAAQDLKDEPPEAIKVIDLIFTVFFAVELLLRIIVEQQRFIWGRNRGWNIFDSVIVASAIAAETFASSLNTTAIRVLRMMRMARVVRVVRTMKIFNDLRALVKGIIASIISLFWALALLIMICFVIGIFLTQVATNYRLREEPSEKTEVIEGHFGSVLRTMYSLYKAITGGDDWSAYADPLFEISPLMGIFFCLYIAFAVFAVLNVVTGVFVDNAIKANSKDSDLIIMEQTEERKKHIQDVKSVFRRADTDGSGLLSWSEFQAHLDHVCVQAYFRQLDLDLEDGGAAALFTLLDFDGNGMVDIEEFIFGCGQLKGYAKSLDLARMGHGQRQFSQRLMGMAAAQSDRLDAVAQMLERLNDKVDNGRNLSGLGNAPALKVPGPLVNGHFQGSHQIVPPVDIKLTNQITKWIEEEAVTVAVKSSWPEAMPQ